MTTIAQQLGQLEQDIYALAKRPSSEVLLAIDSRISAIRAAVGGEAVPIGWLVDGVPFLGRGCADKTAIPFYASPPATVDVGEGEKS